MRINTGQTTSFLSQVQKKRILQSSKFNSPTKTVKSHSASHPHFDPRTFAIFKQKIPYEFKVMTETGIQTGALSDLTIEAKLENARVVTLGDLHANPLKAVENLIAAKLISMPSTEAERFISLNEELEKLVHTNLTFYEGRAFNRAKENTKAQILNLNNNILQIVKSIKWIGGNRQFICLGDEICDRGYSDNITISLFSHLRENSPTDSFQSLWSNHAHLIFTTLFGQDLPKIEGHTGRTDFKRSLSAEEEFFTGKDTQSLTELYQPHLKKNKLFHYDPATKALFAHAPIGKFDIFPLLRLTEGLELSRPIETPNEHDNNPYSSEAIEARRTYEKNLEGYESEMRQRAKVIHDQIDSGSREDFIKFINRANNFMSQVSLESFQNRQPEYFDDFLGIVFFCKDQISMQAESPVTKGVVFYQ